jgi:hypothetical protein
MRDFYVRIKASDAFIRFVFMTGVTQFSRMGVFSSLNNMKDISMSEKYASILGYTDVELRYNFAPCVERASLKLGIPVEKLWLEMKGCYGGFSFDGERKLFNPFSILNFFEEAKFRDFWFESGAPSLLSDYVKKHDMEAEDFRGVEVEEYFASMSEIENSPPESFLYQIGYLSVKEKHGGKLILDYPNREILSGVAKLILRGKYGGDCSGVLAIDLAKSLEQGRAEDIVKCYDVLLSAIPGDTFDREDEKYSSPEPLSNLAGSFYHSLLFSLLWASCSDTRSISHSYRGRGGILVEKNGHRYVIALWIAKGKRSAARAANKAMKRLMESGYAEGHRREEGDVTLIAIAVDKSRRQVGEYRTEKA